MKRQVLNYLIAAAGLMLLAAGLILAKTVEPEGIMRALPYIFIGVGCGVFGGGTANIIGNIVLKKRPDIEKQKEIEKNDERNIALSSRAKAKAFDIMVFVFGALMLSFALIGTDVLAVLLLVFAYLFVLGCCVYYRIKYEKEM